MDFDEALEEVVAGSVVARAAWPADCFLYCTGTRASPVLRWQSTHDLTLPDTVADDWKVIGVLQ